MKYKVEFKRKPYIQPFERVLATDELKALAGSSPTPLNGSDVFQVETSASVNSFVRRLAYWESVNGKYTIQVLREATTNVVRNGLMPEQIANLLPFNSTVPLPNRRTLRYGTHGLHEYRGKFFPQLVLSLINIGNVPKGGVVGDPMCGSGTTIVEAVLSGCFGLGLDANPLSVLMAKTKTELLSVDPSELSETYLHLRDCLLHLQPRQKNCAEELPYFTSLSEADQNYLSQWFSEQVLCDLDQIKIHIDAIPNASIRDLFILALSNILRSVSWQKEDDLRVRKEIKNDIDLDPYKEFLEEAGRSVRVLLAFLYQNQGTKNGGFRIFQGSALKATEVWKKYSGKVDTIITSPPYATALPYLDTDRLSLCYLGLLPRTQHQKQNLEMIGNREVTDRIRVSLWQDYLCKQNLLPNSVSQLIGTIDRLNTNTDVGFRRRNLPALLSKYFIDMQQVFSEMIAVLKPGANAFVVVGNNHTIAGGKRVDIETANLLTEVASDIGFLAERNIPMEMLVSRDIFKKNAVASEFIIVLRKPA